MCGVHPSETGVASSGGAEVRRQGHELDVVAHGHRRDCREHGFEGTTTDDIAAHLGIGRRTLSRYDPLKNDIRWASSTSLRHFRESFEHTYDATPMAVGLREAVVAFNTFPRRRSGSTATAWSSARHARTAGPFGAALRRLA